MANPITDEMTDEQIIAEGLTKPPAGLVYRDSEQVLDFYMLDAEADPFRVSVTSEDAFVIHPEENKHIMLTADLVKTMMRLVQKGYIWWADNHSYWDALSRK